MELSMGQSIGSQYFSVARCKNNFHKGLKKRICYICGKKFETMISGVKICSEKCNLKYKKNK